MECQRWKWRLCRLEHNTGPLESSLISYLPPRTRSIRKSYWLCLQNLPGIRRHSHCRCPHCVAVVASSYSPPFQCSAWPADTAVPFRNKLGHVAVLRSLWQFFIPLRRISQSPDGTWQGPTCIGPCWLSGHTLTVPSWLLVPS